MTLALALPDSGARTCQRTGCSRVFREKNRRPDGLCKPHGIRKDIYGHVTADRGGNR